MNVKPVAFEDVPSLVQIETTYACNHKCVFCYNPRRDEKLNVDVLDMVVDSVARSQIPHVYFVGGEPSLVPIEKLNEYIEKLSIHSSTAIITNGSRRLENISHKLSCIAVPLHGLTSSTHDSMTGVLGSFNRTVSNIKHYVSRGYDVRCVLVLTGYNYADMYELIGFAASLGMESVYVDRYEDGGLGASKSDEYALKPTIAQFREGVTQILKARDDFKIFQGKVGFGTAIPMCLDERLLLLDMVSVCGVGTSFCAINPDGDLRICNQSEIKFGNILTESIETIWHKKDLDVYRNLDWVEEPCRSCKLLTVCQCGCKVDINYSDKFCIDFAIREHWDAEMERVYQKINFNYDGYAQNKKILGMDVGISVPNKYRLFKLNPYLKLHDKYANKKIVTQYRTTVVNDDAFGIISKIVSDCIVCEEELVDAFSQLIDESEIRAFVSSLIDIGALDLLVEDAFYGRD